MRNSTSQFVLAASVLTMFLPGCIQSSADTNDADHHLEHFVPHHKPANFADAVEAISVRSSHLGEHAGHGHSHENEEFQELLEIVDWIPELAADSDLSESQWNDATHAASKMSILLAARKSPTDGLDLKDLPGAIASEFQVLERLVSAAGKPERRISHEHEHHDEDHDENDN